MGNIVTIFWDSGRPLGNGAGRKHLESYFGSVIYNNKALREYIGEDFTFQHIENSSSLISDCKLENSGVVFLLAELKQGKNTRTSFRGLHLVKLLRKSRIKIPLVLFSFLNKERGFDFCDKDDFINPGFMQFFVRLPKLYLWPDNDEQKPLRALTNDELDELLNNQYDKKQKASILLDKLLEKLKRITDDDKHKSMELIRSTLQRLVMWAPEKSGHPVYTTVLPNKLARLNSQSERIALLEQDKKRLLDGIGKDHNGLPE